MDILGTAQTSKLSQGPPHPTACQLTHGDRPTTGLPDVNWSRRCVKRKLVHNLKCPRSLTHQILQITYTLSLENIYISYVVRFV